MQCVLYLRVYPNSPYFSFFFFNDTATTEIYTLSLHDALPIYIRSGSEGVGVTRQARRDQDPDDRHEPRGVRDGGASLRARSEEHTSELQSQSNLVCRLLLEKKKK